MMTQMSKQSRRPTATAPKPVKPPRPAARLRGASSRKGASDPLAFSHSSRAARRPGPPRPAAARCARIDDLLDPELFKALCDPTRALLLACIAKCGRACSVGEVAECCAVDVSVVSRHLAILQRAGVLESTRSGRTVSYAMRYDAFCTALRDLADAVRECAPAAGAQPGSCGNGGCCGNC